MNEPESEDEYLSDANLEDCLITRHHSDGGWIEISSAEYLKRKRELIPLDNGFVDLESTRVEISVYDGRSDEWISEYGWSYEHIPLTEEQIDMLFSKWLEKIDE